MVGPAVISASVHISVPPMNTTSPAGTEYMAGPVPSRVNPISTTTLAGQRWVSLITSSSPVITIALLSDSTKVQTVASWAAAMARGSTLMYWM